MVRQWREDFGAGEASLSLNGVVLMVIAVLASLALISIVVFQCADGASKEKASATQTDINYGGGAACAAGCGGGCGA